MFRTAIVDLLFSSAENPLPNHRVLISLLLALGGCATLGAQEPNQGLTAVAGVWVGHHTLSERPTGCTVVWVPDGAVGGVDVRGGAPGTRETDLLDPVNTVQHLNAVFLAGGSAFGLDVGTGVMRYLEEQGSGYRVGSLVVPIVAGAILFDLSVGDRPDIRPGADCGYRAAQRATTEATASGNVGAGAGATVGKLRGAARSMKGGIGSSSITLEDGLVVAAIVAVNSVGDVVDPSTGRVVAGVRTEDGASLADARVLVRAGGRTDVPPGTNTTIAVVATNAVLTKAQATKLAQMAQDGLARSIYPAHTPSDGDAVFSLATGAYTGQASLTTIGSLAADVLVEAVLDAVRSAEGLPGIPSARDLGSGR